MSVDVLNCAASFGTVKTNEDRISFINDLGYDVEPESISNKDIIIPSEFSDVFNNYNKLQQKAGFDLKRFKGVRARLFSYKVTAQNSQTEYNVNLIICENTVIGGDISSVALDGQMYPLIKQGKL